jgi:hypothetical protein
MLTPTDPFAIAGGEEVQPPADAVSPATATPAERAFSPAETSPEK